MNDITTLEQLIKDAESIKQSIIVIPTHKTFGDFLFKFFTGKMDLFIKWKASVERSLLEFEDNATVSYVRGILNDIDSALINGQSSEDYISNNIDYVVLSLKRVINSKKSKTKKVFIVHGHNELLLSQTESLLHRIGYEPIILRNEANQGQTIIEKFENKTDVAFAIVLYTACDFGCAKEDKDSNDKLRPRARQNVVFEHGYLYAKLGRNCVCALVEEDVESPGDLAGVIYIKYDDKGAWKMRVAREMKAAGLDIDFTKVII